MINLKVGNNIESNNIIVSDDTTIRQAFEQAGIRMGNGLVSLDGANVSSDKFDTPLSALGVSREASLMSIAKLANA